MLVANRARVSSKAPLGKALKSPVIDFVSTAGQRIANYWDGLCLFLTDGHIEMDNDAIERTIRPIALNRKTRSSQVAMQGPRTGTSSPP